jgi:hypothetical protein
MKPVPDYVFALRLDGGMLLQYLLFRGCQNAIETAEDRQRKNDLAVLVRFVRSAEQIADAPDKVLRPTISLDTPLGHTAPS